MTAQIPDSFLLDEKKLSIVGVHGGGLFSPLDHGLQPLPRITSCWRGYVCTYTTLSNKLILDRLQVNLGSEGPPIREVHPVFGDAGLFDTVYDHLNLHIDFTGGILLADGFIRELYVHMGFHPAWKYETVFELAVSQGYILETRDVSRSMAELREKMIRQPLQPDRDASSHHVQAWIASTFKHNYRF